MLKNSDATQAVVLYTLKVFYIVWHADLLYKFRLHGVIKRCFVSMSHFLVVKNFELFPSHPLSVPLILEYLRIFFPISFALNDQKKAK